MSKLENDFEKKLAFQRKLEELISDEDIDKSELPNKIGIAYPTFTRAVNHGIIPKTRILIKIADYFNVSIEYLLNKTDDKSFNASDNNKTLYERFDELKKENGIDTDYQLATKTHLPRQYFYDWKRKNYYPTIEILEYLADYFKVSIDYLLGRTDDR